MALLDSIFGPMSGALAGAAAKARGMDGRTNPNSKPAKKGKNAKSTKARDRAMMSDEGEKNRQFLQQNVFDRTGATRRTMSGQIEKDVPVGLDFFKNSGADRPEVAQRQAQLNAGGLNQPGVWDRAQQAVNATKAQQGWTTPNTPPSTQQGDLNSILRQSTPGVGVFENPAFNNTNPRTNLTTNDGPFTRAMTGPFGSGSAVMTPQTRVQQPSMMSQAPSPGPVDQVFGQMPINSTPPSPNYQGQGNLSQGFNEEQWMQAQPPRQPGYISGLDWLMSLFANPNQNNIPRSTVNKDVPFQFDPM